MNEFVLSVDDVERVVKEHLVHLDKVWPDHDAHGPRKVHIVELMEAVRLKLHMVAQENVSKNESAFERAARKITNSKREVPRVKEPEPIPEVKSDMQIAFEKAREARRNRLQPT